MFALMSDLQARLQAVLGDRYIVERELGRGGYALVYLARDVKHSRHVAIKVLAPELAQWISAGRFLQEIEIAAGLTHPHILALYDSGAMDGLLYYVMPYMEGESLRGRLQREPQLPLADALQIGCEVAAALSYAHRHDILHRDIKPENILLSDGHAVVADFGIARALTPTDDKSVTHTGIAVGTPIYMSPEQGSGSRALDGRSDLYSLACVLYEMLAGYPPFAGQMPQEILAHHVLDPVPRLETARLDVPPAVEQAIRKALAKTPADRFADSDAFALALTEGKHSTPTSSDTRGVRTASLLSRRGLALLAVGIVVLLGGYWLMRSVSGGTPAAPAEQRLAVLPFQNLGAPDDQYFADGITEEITARLARLNGLAVISRTSTMQYKTSTKTIREIGTELGVRYVLEGSIRWQHERGGASEVRVTPQLIRVADDRHLWAEVYSGDLTQVFRVQEEIANKVAEALNVTLLASAPSNQPAQPTSNFEAYDYYLRGNAFLFRGTDGEEYRRAAELYQRAVQLDSGFALAWARLSHSHSAVYWFYTDRSDARLGLAKAAAQRALALDPDLPDAHIALGYYYYWGSRDYPRALEQFAIAQRREPNNSVLLQAAAYVQRRQGHWEEAAANLARAIELDPVDYMALRSLAETYAALRRYREAERYADRAIALHPELRGGYQYKARAELDAGDTADARRTLQDAEQAVGAHKAAVDWVNPRPPAALLPFLGLETRRALTQLELSADISDTAAYYLLKGDVLRLGNQTGRARAYADSARVILEQKSQQRPEDPAFHADLGLAFARLGRKAEAIREGRRAVELLPLSRDAYAGGDMVANLARIYALVGEEDAALERLGYLLSIPSNISANVLRIDPDLAPLRRNPRFRRLVGGN
jgi:TolB-like protein/tRNA A-37 threonylcarbamoyl transferase component Bud32/Flp pilus assembly protein TadD